MAAMEPRTVKDLFQRWPNRSAVLEDVVVSSPDLELVAVHRWAQRNAIPPKYWAAIIAGARRRGIALTADQLVKIHAARTDRGAA